MKLLQFLTKRPSISKKASIVVDVVYFLLMIAAEAVFFTSVVELPLLSRIVFILLVNVLLLALLSGARLLF